MELFWLIIMKKSISIPAFIFLIFSFNNELIWNCFMIKKTDT